MTPETVGANEISIAILELLSQEMSHVEATHATHRRVARDEGLSPMETWTCALDAKGPRKLEIRLWPCFQ
jgi:hypothetical protein